ncbi:nucleolar protein 14 [Scleroderma yunnanense]
MAKGSQLTQLKAALSKAGFDRKTREKKKKNSLRVAEQDKVKKAAKLREIQQKLNPFDVKVTKLKHDVGGRKIKGATGRPAQSKQAGMQQREKTLLKEMEKRGHVGGVVDRRFGESDPTMSLEERMLERFTRERQRSSKADVFNLESEEELTHYGQSLSKLDDFDETGIPMDEDDDEEGQLDLETVQQSHFGGFDNDNQAEKSDEPARKKSKAEVMAEVIAKSKGHKLRRQMEKEQEENIRHQLDHDFDSLRSLLYAPDPSLTRSDPPQLLATIKLSASKLAGENELLDYDKQVRELAFDKRAKPKDRTKTEEELALEQKKALEKAERQRKRRMLGEDPDETEDEAGNGGKRKRARGGDDLDDDFVEDDGLGTGLGAEDLFRRGGEAEEDEEAVSDKEDVNEGHDSEPESGPEDDSDAEEFGSEGDFKDITTGTKVVQTRKTSAVSKELPYTFPAPESHEDFLEMIEDVRDEDVPTVVQRIRTLYHPSLSLNNKFKLQNLTRVLVDHILFITSPPEPRIKLLPPLLSHLFSLSRSFPVESAESFVEKLSLMHKNLKRGLASGTLTPDSRTWPQFAELTLLRVIGTIWPTSDMKHAVVSPARLLMGAYLGLCRVRSFADVTSGLFLSSLFLQYEALSKRLVPEAINFVVNAILFFAPNSYTGADDLPGTFPSPDFRSELCAPLAINPQVANKLIFRKPDLWQMLTSDATQQSRIDAFGLALELLDRFADLYKGLDGFIELYEPIHSILSSLRCDELSEGVQTRLGLIQDKIRRLLKFARQSRQPLLLQAHKPIPIPTYVPKFEQNSSSYLRRHDPDFERNEASKLRYQLKQEKRGSIRELRKDAKFITAVEHQRQLEKDRAYNERMKKVFGSLEGERAEQKAKEREKAKENRRAGRK